GVRPVGAAGGVCADWRQGRRARHSARDARRRPEPARHPSRTEVDGRQELLWPPIRNRARRRRYRPAAPCPQGRETPCGTTLLQATAAGRRIGQQHPQDPARPRTPRRTHHRRSRRTCPTTHPRPHRRHLAQRQNRPADPAITDRIRPLTLGITHLAEAPTDDRIVRDIWLLRLRALLARARGDETAYCDFRDRYRAMATSLGFEGHMKWAEAMP